MAAPESGDCLVPSPEGQRAQASRLQGSKANFQEMPGFSFSGRVVSQLLLSAIAPTLNSFRSSASGPILCLRPATLLLLQLESPSFSFSFSSRVFLLLRIPTISFVSESPILSHFLVSHPLPSLPPRDPVAHPFHPRPGVSRETNTQFSTQSRRSIPFISNRLGLWYPILLALDQFLRSSVLYPSGYEIGAFGQDFPPSPTNRVSSGNHQKRSHYSIESTLWSSLASNTIVCIGAALFLSLSYPAGTRLASISRVLQRGTVSKQSLTCSLYGDGSASPFCTHTFRILPCPERG